MSGNAPKPRAVKYAPIDQKIRKIGNLRYPRQHERQCEKLLARYVSTCNRLISQAFGKCANMTDLSAARAFAEMQMKRQWDLMGIAKQLTRIGQNTGQYAFNQFQYLARRTVGIDIQEDAFAAQKMAEDIQAWVKFNENLIVTVPRQTLGKVQGIIEQGFIQGKRWQDLSADIQKEYAVSENRAKFWARDQTAKLHSDISRSQAQRAGCTEYIWSSSKDERVRKRHKELDGERHSYNNPPNTAEENQPARYNNPGRDYNCRCMAVPIIEGWND